MFQSLCCQFEVGLLLKGGSPRLLPQPGRARRHVVLTPLWVISRREQHHLCVAARFAPSASGGLSSPRVLTTGQVTPWLARARNGPGWRRPQRRGGGCSKHKQQVVRRSGTSTVPHGSRLGALHGEFSSELAWHGAGLAPDYEGHRYSSPGRRRDCQAWGWPFGFCGPGATTEIGCLGMGLVHSASWHRSARGCHGWGAVASGATRAAVGLGPSRAGTLGPHPCGRLGLGSAVQCLSWPDRTEMGLPGHAATSADSTRPTSWWIAV